MYSEDYYPQCVLLEITNACNLKCLHCGSSSGKCRNDELTTAEIIALIDELACLKAEAFVVTGGEPLLRRDWPELVGRIKSHGARCCIASNATLVTPKIIEKIIETKPDAFGCSIDGIESTHDHIRQRPGSFRQATQGFELLREVSGLSVQIGTTISKLNIAELDLIYDHLCEIGCADWKIQLSTAVGRMSDQKDQLLSDEEFEFLVDKILLLKKKGNIRITVGDNIGYYGIKGAAIRDGMPFPGDYLGLRIVGITANGDVKGDLSLPEEFVEGNIRERSFIEIWKSDDTFSYNRKFSMDMVGGFCRKCRYLPLCKGGDASSSFAANGIRANSPYCMYRIENARGEDPIDSELTKQLLDKYRIAS